ncbi:MAG: patatin-like phospholipase family protein [Firmicutes bacterium]|nr:patatin-like phospholipase family protein [Bacillota bacterium]
MGKAVGVALSGGGVLGGAHIGALEALEELGFDVRWVAGTSAGAMVAAAWGAGATTQAMRAMLPRFNRHMVDIDRALWRRRHHQPLGLIRGHRLAELVRYMTGPRRMSQLPRPVAICAWDLVTCREFVFTSRPFALREQEAEVELRSDLPVAVATRASFSIPGLFQPVVLGSHLLVDGGVVENLPVRWVRYLGAQDVIAIDLIGDIRRQPTRPSSFGQVVGRVIDYYVNENERPSRELADVVIHPQLHAKGPLDFEVLQQCVQVGYETTKRQLGPKIELFSGTIPKH